jgi:prevent-host-death family protein
MPTTLTSREFNRNPSVAKKAAKKGPVIITDRGLPRFVLVDYDQYEVATKAAREDAAKPKQTLFDVLGHPASADIDFEPPKMSLRFKPVDFGID